MRAYGTDRLRVVGGDRVVLWCRVPKLKWAARVPKTLTHSEYPGTAVLWEEKFFEVVAAEQLPNGAVEYTLEPWREVHMIRASDRYDAESERARAEEYRAEIRRGRQRTTTLLLGMFAGHLPTGVQERLGNELGVNPARLTLMSTLPAYIALAFCAWIFVTAMMNGQSNPIPLLVLLLVQLALLDAVVRSFVYFTQSRPMGSPFGFIAYVLYYYVFARDRSRLLKPLDDGRGHRLFTLPPPDDVALRDELTTKGSLISLLSVEEQKKLAAIGYDYREHAYALAWVILGGATVGAISSFLRLRSEGSLGALVSMFVAGAVALEQIFRLTSFRRGPAGSFLGVFARPFVRKLLERG